MKKISELRGITYSTFFYKDFIIICNEQKDYLFLSACDYQLIYKINLGNIYPINVVDGRLYLYNYDLYIYDERQNKFALYKNSVNGGNVILYKGFFIEKKYDRKTKELNVVFYDKSGENVMWNKTFYNRSSFLNLGDHLYLTDMSLRHIDIIDKVSGNIQKTLDFENPRISRFVYYYDNTLIVSLKVRPLEEYHLLGLDARTGEEKWRIEHAFDLYSQDPVTGFLYALSGNFYQVIDTKNGKMVCQENLSSEMLKYNVIPEAGGCLTNDGIYFYGRMNAKFGLLNIYTRKFEFVEDLDVEQGVKLTNILYHDDRIYINDTMNVLHIWGK